MSLSKRFSDALASHGYPLGYEYVSADEVRAKFLMDNVREITEAFRQYDERVSKAQERAKNQKV